MDTVAGQPPQSAAQFEHVSPSEQTPSPHSGQVCVASMPAAGLLVVTELMCAVVK
jgi:hypothetical protein